MARAFAAKCNPLVRAAVSDRQRAATSRALSTAASGPARSIAILRDLDLRFLGGGVLHEAERILRPLVWQRQN